MIETQDAGLKVGTETGVPAVHHVRFERCASATSCRGPWPSSCGTRPTWHDILFRDITFKARYFSGPWWGRGEGISFTALPPFRRVRASDEIRAVRVERMSPGRPRTARGSAARRESRIEGRKFLTAWP